MARRPNKKKRKLNSAGPKLPPKKCHGSKGSNNKTTMKSPLSLFDLPCEVRLQIYHYLFENAGYIVCDKEVPGLLLPRPHATLVENESLCTSLLATNKMIRSEALPVLKHKKIFALRVECRIDNHNQDMLLVASLPTKCFQMITEVEVDDPTVISINFVGLPNLQTIRLTPKVFHFHERQRPKQADLLALALRDKSFLVPIQNLYFRTGGLPQLPNYAASKVTIIWPVWFINTGRSVSNGWELLIDYRKHTFIALKEAQFEKRSFTRSKFNVKGLDWEAKRAARRKFKRNYEGWYMKFSKWNTTDSSDAGVKVSENATSTT